MINRYGNKGPALLVQPCKQPDSRVSDARHSHDLVYFKTGQGFDSSKCDLGDYVQLVKHLVDVASPLINPAGHLVIRTKDVKIGGETISPALETWRIPGEAFSLREIIVLAREPPEKTPDLMQDLQIAHEILLVYQKKDTVCS